MAIDGSQASAAGQGLVTWKFSAPSGVSITGWDAEATISTNVENYYAGIGLKGYPASAPVTGEPTTVGCGPGVGPRCYSQTLTLPRTVRPGATGGELVVGCSTSAPPLEACRGPISLSLVRNAVTFRDLDAPTGQAAGGTLLSSGPGAPVSGVVSASLNAGDFGSGVRKFIARVDGRVVGETPSQCEEPFRRATPCPPSLSAELAVDTRGVPDGTHALQVVAVDAAGTEGTVVDGQIVTANGGPVGPGTDANLRGAPNGSYAADDAVITAGWPETARLASKKRSVQRRCRKSRVYRRKHPIPCNGRAAAQSLGTVGFSAKKTNLVRGQLRTASGQPVVGATVSIVASSAGREQQVAAPVTDAAGGFTARIPVSQGSAIYAINWMARARDTVPTTSVALRRSVRASSTFSVARRARAGGRLTFSGRLLGQAGSQVGVPILIQVNAGSGWRAATTIQAKGDGKWRGRYSVPRQLRGTYRFRAAVKSTTRYPYAAGVTRSKRVAIR
jgi:hypothetical protein